MTDKISYQDLGLVNTREMFKQAMAGKFAIPAYNFNNMEQLQAIVTGCAESDSPFILQVSSGARKYANQILLRFLAQGIIQYLSEQVRAQPRRVTSERPSPDRIRFRIEPIA